MAHKRKQFLLLLWKNFLLQKRKVVTTIFEIGLPTFFALILIFIRLRVDGKMMNEKIWAPCQHWDKLNKTLNGTKVAFTPDNLVTRKIMRHVKEQNMGIIGSTGLKSEPELVDFIMFSNATVNNTRDYLAGIVFTSPFEVNNTKLPDDISYKLRLTSSPRNAGNQRHFINPFKDDTSWSTQFMFPLFQRVGPREKGDNCGGAPGYKREGFLALQHAVNFAIFRAMGGENVSEALDNINITLRRHPYPAFNDDNFILVIQQQFPLILMLSFVLVALNIVKDVVHEKERKLKESMKMMGLNNWLHWAAWFVKYFLFLLVTVAIMTLFLCIQTEKGPVIGKTAPSVVFVFLVVYSISTISFCFAVSVFFQKANSGAAAGGILFFVTYIPYFFIQPRYQTLTWGQKILTSLIFNNAMAFGGQIIGMFEGTGSGVQWSNIAHGVSVDDDFSLLDVIVMLLIDAAIYGLITWYVEAVFPGEYGVPHRWYFLFTRSYWCGTQQDEHVPEDKNIAIGQVKDFFEVEPEGLKPGIQIRNLKKEFKTKEGKKTAVCGMTLDMYEGQITALLGHNGAGKTTTMSMLTGFIPTTSGTARVNGYDIREDIDNVRSSLGLCPQHDVLFDTLTVQEHLVFFAKLKGCYGHQIQADVDHILHMMNLENKRHDLSRTLSGGMKRKLSVGIALIGGSKVVILDEPSSGMDPEARRQLWTVLQNNRDGRTMLLSTHFMDEADHLGDRIAIMAKGIVKCCGSSKFLKNKYGAGYHMTIVKSDACDINLITERVNHYVPEAQLENDVAAELSYILPSERSGEFPKLFTEMDARMSELGISSYGISVTTMEEVFLRVGDENGGVKQYNRHQKSVASPRRSRDNSLTSETPGESSPLLANFDSHPSYVEDRQAYNRSTSFTSKIEHNKNITLLAMQFYAMFVKRALHTFRNMLITSTQLAVPLFFTITCLIVIKTFPGPHDSPPLNLTVKSLGDNMVVYSLPLQNKTSYQNISTYGKFYASQFDFDDLTQVTFVNNKTYFKKNPDILKYLLHEGRDDIGGYNLRYLIGAKIESQESDSISPMAITALFNNQAFHTPAVTLAVVANSLLQYLFNNSDLSLEVINHPLPRTTHDKVRDEMTSETTGFTIAFNVVFGMAFLASSFTVFLIRERATKAKHLQFSSGARLFTFWSATFCWDVINYLMTAVCLILTIWAFDVDGYVVKDHLAHVALLFLLYGFAMLPFMYLCSFIFSVPATGYVWLTMFNILSGVATILAVGILSIPQLGLEDLSRALEWVFLILLPNYCLGQGLEDYYSNYKLGSIFQDYCVKDHLKDLCLFFDNPCCRDVTGRCGPQGCINYNPNSLGWESNGIGRMLIFLIVQSVLYFTILFMLESQVAHRLFQIVKKRTKPNIPFQTDAVQEDDDVARERSRIANNTPHALFTSDKLVLSELQKIYGTNLAVNRISLGVPKGECFGLLGVNGAGKTSTFKMLTGDESISGGSAYLNGQNVSTHIADVRRNLGYCPQFDALIDQMSGRETLYMYARLRGIHRDDIPRVVEDLLGALLLKEHADKLVQTYSGGNKRKLSTAIALVGNPPVIFLDEPTTGMDPNARRYLWDTLSSIRASGRTLILTSHSMEECEALCTRLAVMVNGQFKCLGSPQHLKNKFSEGYILMATVGPAADGSPPDSSALCRFIEHQFPGCNMKDIDRRMVHYHVTDTSLSLAQIFGTMERAKDKYNIEDYSVSQTTLEQVFINFARSQVPPLEAEARCCHGFCLACSFCSSCTRRVDETESYADSMSYDAAINT